MQQLLPLLEEQIYSIPKPRPTLIFPEADDPRVLIAASQLTGHSDLVLITSKQEAIRKITEENLPIKGSLKRFLENARFIVPEQENELVRKFLDAFMKLSEGKLWAVPEERARKLIIEPVMFSCMAVRLGYADAILGGITHASKDFFRPALRLLHTDEKAFEMGIFSLPDEHPKDIYQKNIVAFADVAINTDPSSEDLAHIAVGACRIMRDLIPVSVLPFINGAILSYSTRGSAVGASVDRIRKAGDLVREKLTALQKLDPIYKTIRIEAELQISCAISIAAASSKLKDALADPDSPVGRANVLILPSLDAGNLMYHLYATRYPHAQKVLMVGGMNNQVLDFSRSCTPEDIVLGAAAVTLRTKRKIDWKRTPSDYFFPNNRVLVINPGSTSTKMAVYDGRHPVLEFDISHSADEIAKYKRIVDQIELRSSVIAKKLEEQNIALDSLEAIIGRGGLTRPVISGTYSVNQSMLDDLLSCKYGEHASNLGAPIAHAMASKLGIPAFIADPVVTDELDELARLTGHANYPRRAIWHALSQKAVARRYASQNLRDYDSINVIVAHMGGGVTVGAHKHGRVIYVTNGLEEGPMSAERAGSMPSSAFIKMFFEENLSKEEIKKRLVGRGGLVSYLGTSNLMEIEEKIINGDKHAALILKKLAQDIAAEIAAAIPRFDGEHIDRIILTGGMARSEPLVAMISSMLSQLPMGITVFKGKNMEAEALRDAALRILRHQEEPLVY